MTTARAKTHKGKVILEDRLPKIHENRKKALFIKGRKFPGQLSPLWDHLKKLRSNEYVSYVRENDIVPFEDVSEIENNCRKHDCSLFTFASHNKKRPNNLIFGRLFNFTVLDMYEFRIEDLITDPSQISPSNIDYGWLPALVFEGEAWDDDLRYLKTYFIDYFVGSLRGFVSLEQVRHAIVFTHVDDNKILFRHYLVKNEGTAPKLTLIAPSFTLVQGRSKIPDDAQWEDACEHPPEEGSKKKKTKVDALGRHVGKVYTGKNDLSKIQPKGFKGLPKKSQAERVVEAETNLE